MEDRKETLITDNEVLKAFKDEYDFVIHHDSVLSRIGMYMGKVDDLVKETYEDIITENLKLFGSAGRHTYEEVLKEQEAKGNKEKSQVKITVQDVLSATDDYHNLNSWKHLAFDICGVYREKIDKLYFIVKGDAATLKYRYLFKKYPDLFNPYFMRFYYASIENYRSYNSHFNDVERLTKIAEEYVDITDVSNFRYNIDVQLKKLATEQFVPNSLIVSSKVWIARVLNKNAKSGSRESLTYAEYIAKQLKEALDIQYAAKFNKSIADGANNFANDVTSILRKLYKNGFDTFEQIGIVVPRDVPSDVIFVTVRNGEFQTYRSTDGETNGLPFTSPEEFNIIGGNPDKKKKIRRQAFLQKRIDMLSANIAARIMDTYDITGAAISKNTYLDDYLPDNFDALDTAYLARLHAEFQKADARSAKGILSIRRWLTAEIKNGSKDLEKLKEAIDKGSKVKLDNFKDVERWYKWCLKNIYYKYANELHLDGGSRTETIAELRRYSSGLKNALLKIVVLTSCSIDEGAKLLDELELQIVWQPAVHFLADRKNDESCSPDDISKGIKQKLLNFDDLEALDYVKNDSGSVRVLNATESNGVKRYTQVNISYASGRIDTPLFAKDVLDSLCRSGKLPSWHNVILGLRQEPAHKNEVYAWKDFLDASKNQPSYRAYTIYAGSRSGKGTMTSAIVAAAIASGVKIYYIDGKPENGGIIGRIAWEKGKEAFVFDGQAKGLKDPFPGPLESHTYKGTEDPHDAENNPDNYVRQLEGYTAYAEEIPEELSKFLQKDGMGLFLGLMRYLKAMNLFVDMVGVRAAKTPDDNGVLWVFDEMTNICTGVEAEIRRRFSDYVARDPKAKFIPKNGNLLYDFKVPYTGDDAGIKYINEWCKWVGSIRTKLSRAITITFGASNTDLIMIFQNAKWLADYRDSCLVAQFVETFKDCTKIVGKGALAYGCNTYGDALTVKAPWYKDALCPKKLWAITSEGTTNLGGLVGGLEDMEGKLVIIKPFNIFTIPNKGADAQRAAEDQDFARRYFKGYIEALEEAQRMNANSTTSATLQETQKTTAEKLQEAWDYAADMIVDSDWLRESTKDEVKANVADWLKDNPVLQYMYNVSSNTFKETYAFSLKEFRHSIRIDENGKVVSIDKDTIAKQEVDFQNEFTKIKVQIENLSKKIEAFNNEAYSEDTFTLLQNEIQKIYTKIGDTEALFVENDNGERERTLHGLLLEEYRRLPLSVKVDSDNPKKEDLDLNLAIQKHYYYEIYGTLIPQEELEDQSYKQDDIILKNYIFVDGATAGLFGALNYLSYRLENIGYKYALLSNNGNLGVFRLSGSVVAGFQRITQLTVKQEHEEKQELINKFTLAQLKNDKDDTLFKLIEEDYKTLQNNYARICKQILDYVLTDTLAEYIEDANIFFSALAQVFKGNVNSLSVEKKTRLNEMSVGVNKLLRAVGKLDDDSLATLVGCNAVVGDVLMTFNAIEHLATIIPELLTSNSGQEVNQGRQLWRKLQDLSSNRIVSDLAKLQSIKIDLSLLPKDATDEYSAENIEEVMKNTKMDFISAKKSFSEVIDKMKDYQQLLIK